MKKARLWLVHVFCTILDRISNFVYVNEKFCNKKIFLDLFSVVLIVSRFYTAQKMCIEAVVWNLLKLGES